jgi:hypothetical protein
MASIFTSSWEGTGILDSSTWTAEGGSDSGVLTVATDQFLGGTHSLKANTTTSTFYYVYRDFTTTATCGARFGIRVNSFGATNGYVFMFFGAGDNNCSIRVDGGAGTIYCVNEATSGHIGSDFTYTANTWYQVELLFVNATSIKWKVWNAAGTSLVLSEQTSTTSIRAADTTRIYAGLISGLAGTVTFWEDVVAADNAVYPGPYVSGGFLNRNYFWDSY